MAAGFYIEAQGDGNFEVKRYWGGWEGSGKWLTHIDEIPGARLVPGSGAVLGMIRDKIDPLLSRLNRLGLWTITGRMSLTIVGDFSDNDQFENQRTIRFRGSYSRRSVRALYQAVADLGCDVSVVREIYRIMGQFNDAMGRHSRKREYSRLTIKVG